MIKRTIEVSSGPTHLSIRNAQLVVSRDREELSAIPCEDIGLVIIDHPAVTYSHAVVTALAEQGAVIIACGKNHHPVALVMPVEANSLHTERLRAQVESSRPSSKRLWQQLVQAKVRAQAEVLDAEHPVRRKLLALVDTVRSGDPSNIEAQAARAYWPALFPDGGFRRDPEGAPPNNLLNYGYMALRAAVARAICGAGLHPSIGLHHRNRYNPFCLADDLVEPLRPMVDEEVRALWQAGCREVDKDTKSRLLGLLVRTVETAGEKGPLMVGLGRMMASLVRCLEGVERRLEIPSPCT